jgi:hypothetical protein
MKTNESQTLEFLYQENAIHFLVNPKDDNVMVNATEMAKLFNKEVRSFLRLDGTKKYIDFLVQKENIRTDVHGYIEKNIYHANNKAGTFMTRKLALKFAIWLDVEFEDWVIDTIDNVIFGNLKIYRDAMAEEVRLKNLKPTLKDNLLENPTKETVTAYFDNEESLKNLKRVKDKATRNQLSLFKEIYSEEKTEQE